MQAGGKECSLFRIPVTVLFLVSFLFKADSVKVSITLDLCVPLPRGV